jgi:hypothetical protein
MQQREAAIEQRRFDELALPLRSRSCSASRMPMAAFSPVTMSTTGTPTRSGPPPDSPFTLMMPVSAWMAASYPGKPPSGPSAP